MNTDELLTHILEIKVGQAKLATKMDTLESTIRGNGQPGLVQKVEDLQAAKNWMIGIGSGITFLLGWLEYFIHRKR